MCLCRGGCFVYGVEWMMIWIGYLDWCCVVWVWCLLGICLLGGGWCTLKVFGDKWSVCVHVLGACVWSGGCVVVSVLCGSIKVCWHMMCICCVWEMCWSLTCVYCILGY